MVVIIRQKNTENIVAIARTKTVTLDGEILRVNGKEYNALFFSAEVVENENTNYNR